MKYKIIIEDKDYALILCGEKLDEYAVVNGLDNSNHSWLYSVEHYSFSQQSSLTQAEALNLALNCFRELTDENYAALLQKNGVLFINNPSGLENDIWQYSSCFSNEQWNEAIDDITDSMQNIYNYISEKSGGNSDVYKLGDAINLLRSISIQKK